MGNDVPHVVCWGGGVNSTAMLCEFYRRGIRVDLVLFADTGGEKPETYAYLDTFSKWLVSVGFPPITVVSYADNSKHKSLEQQCLTLGVLPSLAYGWKTCSLKWKKAPQDRFINSWEPAAREWSVGGKVRKAIGYDSGEMRRAKKIEDPKYEVWYPLIEWNMKRADCIKSIELSGLPVPPKSACFFCPASKADEILKLRGEHPDLYERAIALEKAASDGLVSVKGLGRRFAWADLTVGGVCVQSGPEVPCGCFDESEDDDE